MEALSIELEPRTTTGKGAARKARAAGRVPGILYGHGKAPIMFDVDAHRFGLAIEKSRYGRNQLFALKGVERDVQALIKEVQVHPVSRRLIHVDLIEVTDADRVRVEVEVKHEGKAAGQSAGGTLVLLKRTVKLLCAPESIPDEIVVDVTPLGLGVDVTVGDLPLPSGAQALGDPKVVVLTIKAPRVSGKAAGEEEADKKKKK